MQTVVCDLVARPRGRPDLAIHPGGKRAFKLSQPQPLSFDMHTVNVDHESGECEEWRFEVVQTGPMTVQKRGASGRERVIASLMERAGRPAMDVHAERLENVAMVAFAAFHNIRDGMAQSWAVLCRDEPSVAESWREVAHAVLEVVL